ncbi:unnamed protein product [Amoebophrya sp. A120]|nr:unnamed protein product [Amoebophrya sp. A120]|eukprot:GSA120T00006383001.1
MGLDDIDDSDDDILPSGLSRDSAIQAEGAEAQKKATSSSSPRNKEKPDVTTTPSTTETEPADDVRVEDGGKKAKAPDVNYSAGSSSTDTSSSKPTITRDTTTFGDRNSASSSSSLAPEELVASKFLINNPGSTSRATSSIAAAGEEDNAAVAEPIDHSNDAQDELMKLMAKKRQQKEEEKKQLQKEEEKKKQKELLKEGGLFKKGFLKGAGTKAASGSKSKAAEGAQQNKKRTDVVDLSEKVTKKAPDLSLPEVQNAMKSTLQDTNNWLTPELTRVFASRPDLVAGMQNPKVQECIQMMRSDPVAAKAKFQDDKEVVKYMEDFSRLMGTHFDVLAKKAEKENQNTSNANTGGSGVGTTGSEPTAASKVSKKSTKPMAPDKAFRKAAKNMNLSEEENRKFQDPRVVEAMMDPKVQQVIAMVKAGRGLDMRDIGRRDMDLFQKLRYLLDQGILGVSA